MLYIFSPFINFEVRSLLSLDVSILGNINLYISNIGMYLTIGFLIVLILNILVANNKLVYYYWSISHMYLYVQKLFSNNWCIYITYFFLCTAGCSLALLYFTLVYFFFKFWFNFIDLFYFYLFLFTLPVYNAHTDKLKILLRSASLKIRVNQVFICLKIQ